MGPRVSQVKAATTTRDCAHGQNDATHPLREKKPPVASTAIGGNVLKEVLARTAIADSD